MTNRLFIALKLPEDVRHEIVTLRKEAYRGQENFRWEPEDKLHLTLKFLGDTDESKTKNIIEIIRAVTEGQEAISCEFERFGFFLPRILWFGLKAEDPLTEMAKRLNLDLQKLGFEAEQRNFKAHITLLRMKHEPDSEFVSAFRNFKLPARKFLAKEIALVKSQLNPAGSEYSDIERFILL